MATEHVKTTIRPISADATYAGGSGRSVFVLDTQYSAITLTVTGIGDQEELLVVNGRDTGYAGKVRTSGITINGRSFGSGAEVELSSIGNHLELIGWGGNAINKNPAPGLAPP
jgi:hypothetical protein